MTDEQVEQIVAKLQAGEWPYIDITDDPIYEEEWRDLIRLVVRLADEIRKQETYR